MGNFTSIGYLKYFNDPLKLIVEADDEIAAFYRSLIPKSIKINRPLYPAHISVVRSVKPTNLQYWEAYQGKEIEFEYEPIIYNDEFYYWLNCYCNELEDIRRELGLKPYGDVTWSPDGRHKFHMTIGNLK